MERLDCHRVAISPQSKVTVASAVSSSDLAESALAPCQLALGRESHLSYNSNSTRRSPICDIHENRAAICMRTSFVRGQAASLTRSFIYLHWPAASLPTRLRRLLIELNHFLCHPVSGGISDLTSALLLSTGTGAGRWSVWRTVPIVLCHGHSLQCRWRCRRIRAS